MIANDSSRLCGLALTCCWSFLCQGYRFVRHSILSKTEVIDRLLSVYFIAKLITGSATFAEPKATFPCRHTSAVVVWEKVGIVLHMIFVNRELEILCLVAFAINNLFQQQHATASNRDRHEMPT